MAKMSERHTQILELLTEQKRVEVTELSELLHVSQVTIRKDLDQLENAGLILRAHGFATLDWLIIMMLNKRLPNWPVNPFEMVKQL